MKQRRIKKLVKGHLSSKGVDGQDVYADKKARLAVLDEMDSATLLDTLIGAGVGKGDGDTAAFADDFAPFDAREQVDTDGDNIGDNRDILLTKVKLDAIYKTLENNVVVAPAEGSLQDLLDRLAAAIVDLTACAGIVNAADRQDRYALLLAEAPAPADGGQPEQTSNPIDLTAGGLDVLEAAILADADAAEALKTEIAAMTATNGVTIDVAAPYNIPNAPELTKTDAAATDVAAATLTVGGDVANAKNQINTIEAP